MTLGDTFFPVQPDGNRGHLRVIASKANAAGECVAFNLTTLKKGDPACDKNCILKKGDHPFVKHDTVVDYGRGVLLPLAKMYAVSPQQFIKYQPVRPGVLARIQQGALRSGNVPAKYAALIKASMISSAPPRGTPSVRRKP